MPSDLWHWRERTSSLQDRIELIKKLPWSYSVFATCKKHDIEPMYGYILYFVTYMTTRYPNWPNHYLPTPKQKNKSTLSSYFVILYTNLLVCIHSCAYKWTTLDTRCVICRECFKKEFNVAQIFSILSKIVLTLLIEWKNS